MNESDLQVEQNIAGTIPWNEKRKQRLERIAIAILQGGISQSGLGWAKESRHEDIEAAIHYANELIKRLDEGE